jgi:hypothetical protein
MLRKKDNLSGDPRPIVPMPGAGHVLLSRSRARMLPIALVCMLLSCVCAAQQETLYPSLPRTHAGNASVAILAGADKYFGEFTDHRYGYVAGVTSNISLAPSFDLGLTASIGRSRYERRQRGNFYNTYKLQFSTRDATVTGTTFIEAGALATVKLYPAHYLDTYVFLGGGVSIFTPDDYAALLTAYHPERSTQVSLNVLAGFGFEITLRKDVGLMIEARSNLPLSDQYDAFDSEVLTTYLPNAVPGTSAQTNYDFHISLILGIKYYLTLPFLRGIPNEAPREFRDLDHDGLSDEDEETVYHTNPMKRDTDDDGLTDLREVRMTHTKPDTSDTDGDGLSDFDEVTIDGTDPLSPDSDGDGVPDAREIAVNINPRLRDSDGDGLEDGIEVDSSATDPRLKDSDGDGLDDFEEYRSYHTRGDAPDTDGDGLSDGEELLSYHTDALKPDTDGDGWSDYDEVKKTGTDPLNAADHPPTTPSEMSPKPGQPK